MHTHAGENSRLQRVDVWGNCGGTRGRKKTLRNTRQVILDTSRYEVTWEFYRRSQDTRCADSTDSGSKTPR